MFSFTWRVGILLLGVGHVFGHIPQNQTSCEEFERNARFSPYDVIDSMWKIFYFWADSTEMYPIVFTLPAKNILSRIKEVVDAIDPSLEIEWHKAALIMTPRPGIEVLFLHMSTPGAFRALIKKEQRNKAHPMPEPLLKFADVRIKRVGKYVGMMCCEDLTAYALARLDDIPLTEEKCEKAAESIGYRGMQGRSYLYVKKKQFEDEL